jgi:hypothetical protein
MEQSYFHITPVDCCRIGLDKKLRTEYVSIRVANHDNCGIARSGPSTSKLMHNLITVIDTTDEVESSSNALKNTIQNSDHRE